MTVQIPETDFGSLAVLAFLVLVVGISAISLTAWGLMRLFFYLREQHLRRVYKLREENLRQVIKLAEGE